jgi:hypothetical protein
LKKIIAAIFCSFLVLQIFCGPCTVECHGRIIGDEENYQAKVIYLSVLTSDTTKPNNLYKAGMDKKDLDSICRWKVEAELDSSNHFYYVWTNGLSDWSSCPKKVDCSTKFWPNFIRIKVYDQKKLSFVIDTVFACSECKFTRKNYDYWELNFPDLYLK